MWLNGSMTTTPGARRLTGLAAAVLGLAVAAAWLGALHQWDNGAPSRAVALAACATAAGIIALWWWRTRHAPLGTPAAALLVGTGITSWVLADNISGLPLLGIALGAAVLQFGLAVGMAVGVLLVGILTAVYAATAAIPLGGVLPNIVMTALLVVLAALAAQVVARLEEARDLAEASARSRRDEALATLDRALAAERVEHARALHDDLGQRLTIIGVGLDVALRGRADPDEALASLRTLVRALSPLTPREAAGIDLDAALDRLAGAFAGTGLDVELVRAPGTPDEHLDPLAYRIIQEGLTNVVRHSDARTVTITLDARDGRLVRVADDGAAAGRLEPGFGLTHLRARVEAAGGTLRAGPAASGFVLEAHYPAVAA